MALVVCLAGLVAACGEDVSLGAGRAAPDAAGTDAAAPRDAAPPQDAGGDAAIDVPIFAEPVEIAALAFEGDAKDDDPSLTQDRTLLFFNSEREGGLGQEDIWLATRAASDGTWEPPAPVEALNSEQRETGIALEPDGLAIWWSSDRDGGEGGLDVYSATRGSRDGAWSSPERVDALSSTDDDLVSAVAGGGRIVLLARRAEGEDYDMLTAQRASLDAAFDAPLPIAELNTDDEESDAFLAGGGTQLLFTRDEDLYLAQRAASDGAFGEPAALESLNSDGDDRDAWASDDLSYVVFSSDRGGVHRLYEARLVAP